MVSVDTVKVTAGLTVEEPLHCPVKTIQEHPDAVESDNDMSSVSSCCEESHQEAEESSPKKPRSIFQDYWVKDGSSPSIATSQRPSPPHSVIRDPYAKSFRLLLEEEEQSERSSINTYEKSLQNVEHASKKSRRTNGVLWESWFTASAPSLLRPTFLNSLYSTARACKSESSLVNPKPLASCLRQSRYAGRRGCIPHSPSATSTDPSTPSSSPVRFQPRVEIRRYTPPTETWSPDGWSSWFTYKID
jgi:hypothetical protein